MMIGKLAERPGRNAERGDVIARQELAAGPVRVKPLGKKVRIVLTAAYCIQISTRRFSRWPAKSVLHPTGLISP